METHRKLCTLAAKYLRLKGLQPFNRCTYSVCELERVGECPDAFGWGMESTQLIEVKISRSDFFADKNKHWRKNASFGIGKYRSYLCPEGVIEENDLPENWGLLVYDGKTIKEIVKAKPQVSNSNEEIKLITSLFRRNGIKPQMFSFKNCSEDKTLK